MKKRKASRITIPIDSERLCSALKDREGILSAWSDKFGVPKQAVSGWLQNGRIPPRALFEIAKELKFSSDLVEDIISVPYKSKIDGGLNANNRRTVSEGAKRKRPRTKGDK